jgi:hypothetical protein
MLGAALVVILDPSEMARESPRRPVSPKSVEPKLTTKAAPSIRTPKINSYDLVTVCTVIFRLLFPALRSIIL